MTRAPNPAEVRARSVAQFFFEVGYGACWAEAMVQNDCKPPFKLTDAHMDAAFPRSIEAHEDGEEMDRYLALASATEAPPVAGHSSAPDKCANCGLERKEHHYNGACYGICGDFVPPNAGSIGEEATTLDVFLSAYSQYSDGELVASVIHPTDDLLTLGELRRILAALTEPTPPASVSGEVVAVPREPDEVMRRRGAEALDIKPSEARAVWLAMCAAAPEAALASGETSPERGRGE